MIFIILFLIVISIVVTLNYIDNSNIEKIEDFLENNQCYRVDYYDGKFQAICEEEVIVVENKFSIHLDKALRLNKKDIKSVEPKDNTIVLNDTIVLKFKNHEKEALFYDKLKDSIKE